MNWPLIIAVAFVAVALLALTWEYFLLLRARSSLRKPWPRTELPPRETWYGSVPHELQGEKNIDHGDDFGDTGLTEPLEPPKE